MKAFGLTICSKSCSKKLEVGSHLDLIGGILDDNETALRIVGLQNWLFLRTDLQIPPSERSMILNWNPKQPFINGCFNWMIPNLYIGNGCFTKHPFKTGCLGYQVKVVRHELQQFDHSNWLANKCIHQRNLATVWPTYLGTWMSQEVSKWLVNGL